MTWNTHPSVVTGQTWTSTDHNTYVKGNLDTLFPYTAAQQVAYSTSTATLTTATASAALQVLRSNIDNTAIEFGSIVYKRQGRSTSNWCSVSTSTTYTDYTPTRSFFQCGDGITTAGTSSITYPVAYTVPPVIFVCAISAAGSYILSAIPSTTTALIYSYAGGAVPFVWFTIGE